MIETHVVFVSVDCHFALWVRILLCDGIGCWRMACQSAQRVGRSPREAIGQQCVRAKRARVLSSEYAQRVDVAGD